jgi:hypothetical protein
MRPSIKQMFGQRKVHPSPQAAAKTVLGVVKAKPAAKAKPRPKK